MWDIINPTVFCCFFSVTLCCGFIIHNTQLSEIPVNNLITFQQFTRHPSQSQNCCLLSHLMTERSFASVILIQKNQHITCTECFMQNAVELDWRRLQASTFSKQADLTCVWLKLCCSAALGSFPYWTLGLLDTSRSGWGLTGFQTLQPWLLCLPKLYYAVYLGLFCSELTTCIMSGGTE